jgi:hypothetical protein
MSTPAQLWGEVRQLGYVVPASTLERAMAHWVTVRGVGPWFVVEHPEVHDFVHRGEAGTLDFTFALAQAGDLQIELIAQHNDQASTYLDFLSASGGVGGLHHLAYWPEDMDEAFRQATGVLGYELWTAGRIGPTGQFRYFDTTRDGDGDHLGTVVEHANIRPATRSFFAELAERSRRFNPATDAWFATR